MAEEKKMISEKSFDVLRRPIISEKASKLAEANGLAFEIARGASKKDVANAFSAIYNAAPKKINIVNIKGKVKTFRGKSKGVRRDVKKAYITLPQGSQIDILAEAGKGK